MKRTLKPRVQSALITTELFLLMFVGSINDFTVEGLPVFVGLVAMLAIIGTILGKWGKF